MLTPEQLDRYPDAIVRLFSQVELDAIADMARRINTYDFFIPSAQHQFQKLKDTGQVEEYVMQELSAQTYRSWGDIKALFQEAGVKSIEFDDHIYEAVGLTPARLAESAALNAVLQAGLEKTKGLFNNLTKTTANTASKQFEDALDRAYMQVTTGAFDANAAIRGAIKSLANKGIASITYPSGHTDYLDVAVRRATLTGVNQTAAQLQLTRAAEMGCDLLETTAHAGARPAHAGWQGGVYSRSGDSERFPNFEASTGYGTGAGLCGWNCKHSFFPYFEGYSQRAYGQEQLERFNDKTITYSGKEMTEYDASQKQRYIERQIRKYKREYMGMEAAKQSTAEAAGMISKWQDTQKDFLAQTGLKQQRDRSQVFGFGRSEAGKATQAKKSAIIKETVAVRQKNIDIIQDQRWFALIKPENRKELVDIFKNATDGELIFWARHGDLVKGDFYDRKAGGYYSPYHKEVHMQIDKIDERNTRIGHTQNNRVFFHETGHLFDDNILPDSKYIFTELEELQGKLTKDYLFYANAKLQEAGLKTLISLDRLSAKQKMILINDLLDDGYLKNAISDIVGGMTNGRIIGMYGHDAGYWKRPQALEKEVIAHLFEAKMLKGEKLEFFRRYFPDTYNYFEEFMKNLEV